MTKPKPKPTNRTTASNRRRPNVATRSKSSWRPSWPLNFNSRQALIVVGLLAVVGFIIFLARAGASQWEVENWTKSGNVPTVADSSAAGGSYINFAPTVTPAPGASNYTSNLQKLQSSPYRNKNNDNSPFLNVASAALPKDQLYGTRQDLANRGEGRNLTPDNNIGIFRAR